MYAKVVIDNPSSSVDYEYDYLILKDQVVSVGVRVKVPFGDGNKEVLGIVTDIISDTSYKGFVKAIKEVMDFEPIISKEYIELAKYIKKETISPLSRIFNCMIPNAKRLKSEQYLKIINGDNIDSNLLEMFNGENIKKYTDSFSKYHNIIEKAIKNKDLVITTTTTEKTKKKWIVKYSLLNNANNFLTRNIDVYTMLENLKEPKTFEELNVLYNISKYTINKLVKNNILKENYIIDNSVTNNALNIKTMPISKNKNIEKYLSQYFTSSKFLYIPSSRDEEISFLVNLINEEKQKGKNTLILVPDILRGCELYSILIKYLPFNIINMSHKMKSIDELNNFDNIKNNLIDCIITTPGYALWPYQNLGLVVIIDQEHSNYRFDQSPRYDVNNVMLKMQEVMGFKLINHSYVPLLNTYKDALFNKITLLKSDDTKEKNVEIINMLDAFKNLESRIVSNKLLDSINEMHKLKKTTLLILNNKAHSKYLECDNCGHTIKCPKCMIPLQYHEKKNQLACPGCYYKIPFTNKCPKCLSNSLTFNGFGIENLVSTLNKINKDLKILTLLESDFSTLDILIDSINEQNVDIIVTTDYLSRGIHNKNIGLIGIVDFDSVINKPSYNAYLDAYSLLEHARIINEDAKMLIQTTKITHNVLKYFILSDYDEFYFQELNNRKLLKVEPIYEVNRILVSGEYKEVFKIADNIKRTILNLSDNQAVVIGPTYNFTLKKVQLIIKHNITNITNIYQKIYEIYQKQTTNIIFDRYSKNII